MPSSPKYKAINPRWNVVRSKPAQSGRWIDRVSYERIQNESDHWVDSHAYTVGVSVAYNSISRQRIRAHNTLVRTYYQRINKEERIYGIKIPRI